MQETKYFCDRCGKEVKKEKGRYRTLWNFSCKTDSNQEYSKGLCKECHESVVIIVKGLLQKLPPETEMRK